MASIMLPDTAPDQKTVHVVKLSSFNVHGWHDAEHRHNMNRVVELVQKQGTDVLCLQECGYGTENLTAFCKLLGRDFSYIRGQGSVAIVSRWPLGDELTSGRADHKHDDTGGTPNPYSFASSGGKHSKGGKHNRAPQAKWQQRASNKARSQSKRAAHRAFRRMVAAQVQPPSGMPPFVVASIHLDHRYEPTRLEQLDKVRAALAREINTNCPMVWCGDFNALTRRDYSAAELEEVSATRRHNKWEAPQFHVTDGMREMGWSDPWLDLHSSLRVGPPVTCRFDTRIDYTYVSPGMEVVYKPIGIAHIQDDASDHNMIVTSLKARDEPLKAQFVGGFHTRQPKKKCA